MILLHGAITAFQNDPDPTETREWVESVQPSSNAKAR